MRTGDDGWEIVVADLIAKDALALAPEATVDALQQLLHLPCILLLQPARMQGCPVLLIPLAFPLALIPEQISLHAEDCHQEARLTSLSAEQAMTSWHALHSLCHLQHGIW